jgi:hypothetical protein
MLEMKTACESCNAPLPAESPGALICSYECTWCPDCAAGFETGCPNCHGQLVARPTRLVG